ncbi:alpha/beta hydrolase [Pendulispora rubella]|uniref:Alpha/beta hydrolase n=1 Tax=Pendulispora rubella TaxID=2741070 RepID=A0ABZ2LAR7_9BACT
MTQWMKLLVAAGSAASLGLSACSAAPPKPPAAPSPTEPTSATAAAALPTTYRTVKVDGLDIFYREAGPRDAPVLLMLHGFPSSSRMYEPLLRRLSGSYHIIAPDYPGFGHSTTPPPEQFAYTFDHLAEVIDHLAQTLALGRYTLVLQDYGGPVGFRIAMAHPERVQALVLQNANAYEEGLGTVWGPRRAFWADRAKYEATVRANLASFEANRTRHVGNSAHPERFDPDTWTDETAFLQQPGQLAIQMDLFYDYRTNVAAYPTWQAYLRKYQPPTLVVWGKNDRSFPIEGGRAFSRDVPRAEIHELDAGHFALDEAPDAVADAMRRFLASHVVKSP